MKIILIGNHGQVGREMQLLAEEKGIQVVGFDIDNLDITNSVQVNAKLQVALPADFLINAAAYTAVDKAEDESERAFAVNRDGVINLANFCKNQNIPLLHISTDYIFSGEKGVAYLEKDGPDPLNIYGKSKLAGEVALQKILEKYIILRVSWVFGRYGHNFVKTMVNLAKTRETISVVADQYGSPTPALDIARVLIELCEKISAGENKWGIYNYCGLPAVSWYDFAKEIVDLAQSKTELKVVDIKRITTEEFPVRAKRPENSALQVSKIIRDYGIERRKWYDYLAKMLDEYLKEQHENK